MNSYCDACAAQCPPTIPPWAFDAGLLVFGLLVGIAFYVFCNPVVESAKWRKK